MGKKKDFDIKTVADKEDLCYYRIPVQLSVGRFGMGTHTNSFTILSLPQVFSITVFQSLEVLDRKQK